ncbi:FAD-dependent oxidoreductase [Ectothiorhodospiraceae bacterium WFHF3C12]|nr:FAD-dependent oxidoreductase [Ectothiorhodospiraceae bacterium WFHF3C12]
MAVSDANHVDVAIVGAGFAGLAAGRALRAASVSARLLEAGDRPGGRAWTESTSLGVPFDRGCAWLHQASRNPLRALADTHGIRYARKMPTRFAIDGTLAEADRAGAIQAHLEASFDAITRAGWNGIDAPAAAYLDATSPWSPIARYLLTTINAVEPENYSTAEAAAEEELDEDWITHPGLGALADALAEGLPVNTGCRVRRIRYDRGGVRVDSDRGTLRARAAIITVSNGVLAGGGLAFEPGLPADKIEALDGLPMGWAEKIALLLDDDALPLPENTYLSILDREGAFGFHVRPFGLPVAVAYTGGELARNVADWPEADAVAFARRRLSAALGEAVGGRVRAGTRTCWRHATHIAGSYSAARPGCHHLRAVLATPVAQRLFFAGEATDGRSFATAHGAWQSGQRAAGEVLAALPGRD